MAGSGFTNDVMHADNVDFTGNFPFTPTVTLNGQLLIGSTATPNIKVGVLRSPNGTLTIGYASPDITIDLVGGSTGIDSFAPDTGTNPVVPDVNGLVSILGRSGSKTVGGTNSLTVKSPAYADQGGSTSVTLNSGSFATAAITLTTPVTAGLADGDLLEFVATNGVLVIQLAATQVGHIGNLATSAAGTMTSTATGDALCLRYQASTNDWWATSVIGTWLIA